MNAKTWTVIAAASGAIAALAARKAAHMTWETVMDEEPPDIQDDPDTKRLLLWTGISALVGALASVVVKLGVHSLREDTEIGPDVAQVDRESA